MNGEQERFLNLRHLPARLDAKQAAWLLGFQPHEIPPLVARSLLKPLGHPPANGHKYFATAQLQELKLDAAWLARATDAIVRFWAEKNRSRSAARLLSDIGPSALHGTPFPINPRSE